MRCEVSNNDDKIKRYLDGCRNDFVEGVLLLVEIDLVRKSGIQDLRQLVLQLPGRVLAVVCRVQNAAHEVHLLCREPQLRSDEETRRNVSERPICL